MTNNKPTGSKKLDRASEIQIDDALQSLLDDIDDKAQEFNSLGAKELIERLRDEINLRADDFEGYFGEAR